jgi:hypothetical protein
MRIIALFILISLLSFSCNKNVEKEKFLIPNGYKGRIVVFFNQRSCPLSKMRFHLSFMMVLRRKRRIFQLNH